MIQTTTHHSAIYNLRQALSGLLLVLSSLMMALWLAWQILIPLDFGYSLGYQWLNIEQHIQIYGPQNQFKRGFADTDPQEHQRLFRAILQSINQKGTGLKDIVYHTHSGRQDTLLRQPEIIHLQDVVRLLTQFGWVSFAGALYLLSISAVHIRNCRPLPGPHHIGCGILALLTTATLVILIMGAKAVFYWLHIQIFPDDHQWFFFYQESLMTTLMKAPDLFGFFAALWGLVALPILGVILFTQYRLVTTLQRRICR